MSSSQLLSHDGTIASLPAYKTFHPISGYAGHIPGEKWRIGSHENSFSSESSSIRSDSFTRSPAQLLNGSSLNQGINVLSSTGNGQDLQISWGNNTGGAHQLTTLAVPHESNNIDGHHSQTFVSQTSSNDKDMTRSTTNVVVNNSNVNSDNHLHAVNEHDQSHGAGQQQRLVPTSVADNHQHQSTLQYPLDGSRQRRLRSVSAEQRAQQNNYSIRRQEQSRKAHLVNDVFAGLKSGWWSQGEVMRNRQRREMAMRGLNPNSTDIAPLGAAPSATRNYRYFDNNSDVGSGNNGGGSYGGGGSASAASIYEGHKSMMEHDQKRIPIAGYSGHVPGMLGSECGKSFDIAARECLEHYWAQRLQQLKYSSPLPPSQ